MIVAITGHRPPKVGGYYWPNMVQEAICARLNEAIRRFVDLPASASTLRAALPPNLEGARQRLVLSGMALGVDQWAAELCFEGGIPYGAIIPFHGYESQWPRESQNSFNWLLQRAYGSHYVVPTRVYRAAHLFRRNAWLVDHCDVLLAVWNGSTGGTASCVEYARQTGRRVELVDVPLEIWDAAREHEQRMVQRRGRRNETPQARPERLLEPLFSQPTTPAPIQPQPNVAAPEPREAAPALRVATASMAMAADYLPDAELVRQVEDQVRRMEQEIAAAARIPEAFLRIDVRSDTESDSPKKEEAKEVISPEKRFVPGRLIDID